MTRGVGVRSLLLGGGILLLGTLLFSPASRAQPRGAVIVPRAECDPSIQERPTQPSQPTGLRRDVTPFLGLLPASYGWIGDVLAAIRGAFPLGSIYQQPDPTYLGYRSDQIPGLFGPIGFKQTVNRLYAGFKGIGGRNVTDVAQLGVVGRQCPGDPFWVGFPRPGNVEFPPPYQTVHYNWDCFCRYDELVACPIGYPPPLGLPIHTRQGPNTHKRYGGNADFISCSQCFGSYNIRKHDFYVGTKKGPHFGYPSSMASDSGYQECLRQSLGSGTDPQQLYGL